MTQAAKRIMGEVIEEEVTKEKIVDIKELMKNLKLSAEQAMQALGIPDAEQSKYSAMLKAK